MFFVRPDWSGSSLGCTLAVTARINSALYLQWSDELIGLKATEGQMNKFVSFLSEVGLLVCRIFKACKFVTRRTRGVPVSAVGIKLCYYSWGYSFVSANWNPVDENSKGLLCACQKACNGYIHLRTHLK